MLMYVYVDVCIYGGNIGILTPLTHIHIQEEETPSKRHKGNNSTDKVVEAAEVQEKPPISQVRVILVPCKCCLVIHTTYSYQYTSYILLVLVVMTSILLCTPIYRRKLIS